jgi:nucleotide-binding universal stress UspA family protein
MWHWRHFDIEGDALHPAKSMYGQRRRPMRIPTTGTSLSVTTDGPLIYVTDAGLGDCDEALHAACDLAESNGSQLEILHVVDLVDAPSMPDAHMGIQSRLDRLAQRLRHLKRNVVSILLFGRPEDVIAKRAADVRARLIAFGHLGTSSSGRRQGMVRRIMQRVACPVIILPHVVSK